MHGKVLLLERQLRTRRQQRVKYLDSNRRGGIVSHPLISSVGPDSSTAQREQHHRVSSPFPLYFGANYFSFSSYNVCAMCMQCVCRVVQSSSSTLLLLFRVYFSSTDKPVHRRIIIRREKMRNNCPTDYITSTSDESMSERCLS